MPVKRGAYWEKAPKSEGDLVALFCTAQSCSSFRHVPTADSARIGASRIATRTLETTRLGGAPKQEQQNGARGKES